MNTQTTNTKFNYSLALRKLPKDDVAKLSNFLRLCDGTSDEFKVCAFAYLLKSLRSNGHSL